MLLTAHPISIMALSGRLASYCISVCLFVELAQGALESSSVVNKTTEKTATVYRETATAHWETVTENWETATMYWETTCPKMCKCYQIKHHSDKWETFTKVVDCSNNELTTLPQYVPNDTNTLLLCSSYFSDMPQLPKLPSLKYLDLQNSSIRSLSNSDLFKNVKGLKHLKINMNTLTKLQDRIFSELTDLNKIDLSENYLANISDGAFYGLHYLTEITLRNNSIKSINSAWFQHTTEIRQLDISQNLLSSIDDKAFDNLQHLKLLNISHNQIKYIDSKAFIAQDQLIQLDLADNLLDFVPTKSLQTITFLGLLILDSNPIHKINRGDFLNMNITKIDMRFMKDLEIIAKNAFQNLPLLVSIEAHDNPRLIYIDAEAFNSVPNLRVLYLHNNQLTALSSSFLQLLPSLAEIHLYRNPIRCNCNAFWIKRLTEDAKFKNISSFLPHYEFIKCDYPLNFSGISIDDVDEQYFDRVCPPTTLPSFQENYTLDFGEELRLECNTYGVPNPKLVWILPNGTEINGNFHSDNTEIIDNHILILRYLKMEDSGTYACKAENGVGFDISSTKIAVTNKPVRLVLFTVSYDYISVSWNGTKHKSMVTDYQLQFKEINDANDSVKNYVKVIPLNLQYRSYTVTNLKPNTAYEFCIVYGYEREMYKVDCKVIKTTDNVEYNSAIQNAVSEKIIAGVCTAVGLVLAIACMVTLVKWFRHHKNYVKQTEDGRDDTVSIYIPLKNVYQSPYTSMSLSKTSLLSA